MTISKSFTLHFFTVHTAIFTAVCPGTSLISCHIQLQHDLLFSKTFFLSVLCFPSTKNNYVYTLSHPENDRDVTESAQGYTLQDASFVRQSQCSFLNVWENTQVALAWQASLSGIRADVTVVLGVIQSIECHGTNYFTWTCGQQRAFSEARIFCNGSSDDWGETSVMWDWNNE